MVSVHALRLSSQWKKIESDKQSQQQLYDAQRTTIALLLKANDEYEQRRLRRPRRRRKKTTIAAEKSCYAQHSV